MKITVSDYSKVISQACLGIEDNLRFSSEYKAQRSADYITYFG